MELVAIDLEGSGAQDRNDEAILEIALVSIVDWRPDTTAAYCTARIRGTCTSRA